MQYDPPLTGPPPGAPSPLPTTPPLNPAPYTAPQPAGSQGPPYAPPPPRPPPTASVPMPPTHPPQPRTSREPVKLVTGVTTGLLAALVIGLSYATVLASLDLLQNPEGPLSVVVIFTIVDISLAVWVCSVSRVTAIRMLIPVALAILAGAVFTLYYASVQSFKNGTGLPDINYAAVFLSAAIFGGMAAGSLLSYVVS